MKHRPCRGRAQCLRTRILRKIGGVPRPSRLSLHPRGEELLLDSTISPPKFASSASSPTQVIKQTTYQIAKRLHVIEAKAVEANRRETWVRYATTFGGRRTAF